MVEVVSCNLLPQAIGDVLGQHGLGQQGCFVLGAYSSIGHLDIVNYVSINAGPVNCLWLGTTSFPSPGVHCAGH